MNSSSERKNCSTFDPVCVSESVSPLGAAGDGAMEGTRMSCLKGTVKKAVGGGQVGADSILKETNSTLMSGELKMTFKNEKQPQCQEWSGAGERERDRWIDGGRE